MHLLQIEQCLVLLLSVVMLHRWHLPFSITCECFRRSNSGRTLFVGWDLTRGSAGSNRSTVKWEQMCVRKTAAITIENVGRRFGSRSGVSIANVFTTMIKITIQPVTCWGCNGN